MEENKTGKMNFIFPALAVIVFLVAFFIVFGIYRKEGEKRSVYVETSAANPDHIEIFANIVSIDAVKGEMTVRMNFEPKGSLANEKGLLNEDIDFFVNNSAGKQEHNFAKHKIMNPIDVTLSLFGGNVTDYPLDTHVSELFLYTETGQKKTDSLNEAEEKAIENVINFSGSVTGFNIHAEPDKTASGNYTILDIGIERSDSVRLFSFFVIGTMWILIIVLFAILYNVIIRHRKIEINMFTFSSSMLFAFPAFRNMMPFAPAIGAFPDYIAFFWAEAAAAMTLVTLIITWISRKQ